MGLRRAFILFIIIVSVGLIALWRIRAQKPAFEEVYAAESRVAVWSSAAMVREQLGTMKFGDRADVLAHAGDWTQLRMGDGATGWVESHDLLDSALWHQEHNLLAQAQTMPLQAQGHTKVLSNLRFQPGRDGVRIYQLGRDTPVDLFERRSISESPNRAKESGNPEAGAKSDDWWFVRARAKDAGELAGWIIGRFIELDLPAPLPDYATAEGFRPAGWFELNHVIDPVQGIKPQYLVIGTRGGQSEDCDFSLLRVYTWGIARGRYETAYVESNFCGHLPVRVAPGAQAGGDASFHFACVNPRSKSEDDCAYRMHQTIIRKVKKEEQKGGEVKRR
ncbi:MAG: hypothetical protein ACRD50_14830 [Candidatus Acidiferrales bacterium]